MTLILPYKNEFDTSSCYGAFVTHEGKFLFVDSNHEDYARKLCLGDSSKNINGIFNNLNSATIKLLDNFNKITHSKDFYTDFLISMLNFDKIENFYKKVIITTCSDPHIRFYNYYLLNWNITCISNQIFKNTNFNYNYIAQEDLEYEKEINEIKRLVLEKERHLFLK